MTQGDSLKTEQRRYVRMDTVFPVEFRLFNPLTKQIVFDWQQGFTNDIGKGGICLSVHKLGPELAGALKDGKVRLTLRIELPFSNSVVRAQAKLAWMKQTKEGDNKYLLGLSYENIDTAENMRLMRYVWAKKLFVPAVFTVVFLLGLGFAVNSYFNAKLTRGNRILVEQLVGTLKESALAKQQLKGIDRQMQDLKFKIKALQMRTHLVEKEREKLKEQNKSEGARTNKQLDEFNTLINRLAEEKSYLQGELSKLKTQGEAVSQEVIALDKKEESLGKAKLDKMYKWLKVHQNPHTGLVMSFEGDGDIANWAFIYDQSLLIQAYTLFFEFDRAKKMLDFFSKKAQRLNGLFFNAYYAGDGNPAEFVVHSGPNIWLGLAIMQYTRQTEDSTYLGLAEEIAQGIIVLQAQDKDSGIRGGPAVEWYATEHNLDAYAFFNMLYKVTGKRKYLDARERVLKWLIKYAYGKAEVPINRGKGDSTIATDTYAWSVAAVGPDKLQEIGMDPDKIMEFAEQNCLTEVSYQRPGGKTVKVRGFDFAPQRHLSRGGVISSEWTAQMVMSFKIMADFYARKKMPQKAKAYETKAEGYLQELGNMIISSPSPSGQGENCLPYATEDFVDTGHGWMTPKGKSTGSVAGTTYTLFAFYDYNPLAFKDEK
ncbi:MAG: PilZ domain-containing protein [Candidatus Omnitrophota bacterium]